ncbi:putative phosphatidate phosphatase isoform X2 [Ochlerotatus camptorhynchus]|uniref:putative phosphatidate phosphatase isoform X2 n=1 Tax=Ochlerotatus camptorhynchus TaxID=644619 RepID=UPI0031E117DE
MDTESLKILTKPKTKFEWPIIFDATVTITVVTFIAISEFGLFPQLVKRGYFCDDRSIQHPFNGDTVATSVLLISGIIPLFLIWITELLFYTPPSTLCARTDGLSTRCSNTWHKCWYWFKKYGRGLVIKLLIVDILKIFSGEHRPHFIDTCRPDVICEGNEYVSTYVCTNTDYRPYFIRDASKSFPSGHSSVSVYASIFMIWYLQKRIPKVRSVMALPLCQILVAIWGIFCSMSRIIDNRHHWWDVLAGSIIGAGAAALTCMFSCHNFDRTKLKASQTTYKEHDINLVANNIHYMTTNGLNSTISS